MRTAGQVARRRVNVINKCVKYFLFICNVLFWLSFMFLMAIGVVAYVLSGGLPTGKLANNFWWMLNITILLMIAGALGTLISFSGCVGSLRENVCLLKLYQYSLLILFLGECTLLALALIYRGRAVIAIEDLAIDAFVKEYREPGNMDTTNFIDWLQRELQCCGPGSYQDWQANSYFSCDNSLSPESCGVPYSCCKHLNDVSANIINTACGYNVQHMVEVAAKEKVWTSGCVQTAINFIEMNIFPAVGIIAAVAFIQLFAMYFSRTLCEQITHQRQLVKRHGAVA